MRRFSSSRGKSMGIWSLSRGSMWAPLAGLIAGAGALGLTATGPELGAPSLRLVAMPASVALEPGTEPVDEPEIRTGGGRLVELPIVLQDVPVMLVGPNGAVEPSFGTRSRCNITSTLTDASFTGGSYVVQAGFSQTEYFAQTYTLQASDFPIKLNLAEAIFATSSASESTTTAWSISFWSGLPTTGTLVHTSSSDDVILPHIRLSAGTVGVNVNFSVDPQDPDQIIISDNGSHQFTVGWRVDVHNQQTGNPCFTAPPTCCNAFPVTDVSGLGFASQNWLFGVNCGPFGCPPNGGWKQFSLLAAACRPSGDSVQRVRWSSISCQPGVGPCCLPTGICQVMTTSDCQTAGGIYQGDGASCSGISCPVPKGACCFTNGFCINNLSQTECGGAGGSWLGVDTSCNGSFCPTGACCLPNGTCLGGVTEANCLSQSGTFQGVGTACAGTNCPQPTGACCTLSSFCLLLTADDCAGIPGAVWKGALTTCVDADQDGRADICPCLADYDQNTFVSGEDFDAFVFDFELGLPAADVDHNTFVTGEDFDLFVEHFEAGC